FLRRSAALAGVGLLAGCGVLPSPAQQTAKVPRVGWLSPGSNASDETFFASFRDGLRELGWVEGQNIAIESRWAEGKFERLPDLAAELVRLKVDVIVTRLRRRPWPPSVRAGRFPSSWSAWAIRWGAGSSPASRARARTSQ